MLFSAKEDGIVESGFEVFEVRLTTNEPLVEIDPDADYQKMFIIDDDGELIWLLKKLYIINIAGASLQYT